MPRSTQGILELKICRSYARDMLQFGAGTVVGVFGKVSMYLARRLLKTCTEAERINLHVRHPDWFTPALAHSWLEAEQELRPLGRGHFPPAAVPPAAASRSSHDPPPPLPPSDPDDDADAPDAPLPKWKRNRIGLAAFGRHHKTEMISAAKATLQTGGQPLTIEQLVRKINSQLWADISDDERQIFVDQGLVEGGKKIRGGDGPFHTAPIDAVIQDRLTLQDRILCRTIVG